MNQTKFELDKTYELRDGIYKGVQAVFAAKEGAGYTSFIPENLTGRLELGRVLPMNEPSSWQEVDPIKSRLEYLRNELRAERISYDEWAELRGLAEHIDAGDTELLEAAGVPEFPTIEG